MIPFDNLAELPLVCARAAFLMLLAWSPGMCNSIGPGLRSVRPGAKESVPEKYSHLARS